MRKHRRVSSIGNANKRVPACRDLYARVTTCIVEDLERGVLPWRRPWDNGSPASCITRPKRANGEPFRGINVLLLWSAASARGYASATWMTYQQALDHGGQVRKGERGCLAVLGRAIQVTSDRKTGDSATPDSGAKKQKGEETDQERRAPDTQADSIIVYWKPYKVFNVEQMDLLPSRFYDPPRPICDPIQRIAHAEALVARTQADVRHGGKHASYLPLFDRIEMPPREAFRNSEAYYATLAHELTHWTGHRARLNRLHRLARFGREAYAREELVAELGAAFLCADLGLAFQPSSNHASYIDSWLQVLHNDKRCVFSAASLAQRAVDYLNGL